MIDPIFEEISRFFPKIDSVVFSSKSIPIFCLISFFSEFRDFEYSNTSIHVCLCMYVCAFGTNVVKMAGMKILLLLTEFQLFRPTFYQYQSSIYTSSLNLTLRDSIFLYDELMKLLYPLTVLVYFCQ